MPTGKTTASRAEETMKQGICDEEGNADDIIQAVVA